MEQFYHKNGNCIRLKENKLFDMIILIVFCLSAIYFIYVGETLDSMPIWVLFILPISVYMYKVSRKAQFRLDSSILEISFFVFFTQKYDLKNFEQFLIIKHRMNFLNNGKEVKMIFKGENKKEVSLLRKYNFKNIENFISETEKIIFKQCLG
ncbi:hypothetical protein [Aquimarina sp. AU119]|uniref:hypothetical protein n=1 Tax=Aquimarina sp. AU119 TaxID=2108528 RepID=UPI000D687F11|nr:hypothetical protein [Aquimarina sp. AU119]